MSDRLSFAIELAKKAGKLLREGYSKKKTIAYKGDLNLVTEFDLRSEELIVSSLRENFPGEGILAEEGGLQVSGEGQWLIDPLDGTTNFAHNIPFFAVSIAFVQSQKPLLGVIFDPMRDELFHAEAGQGVWLNAAPLRVSTLEKLTESLLVTGFPYDRNTHHDNNLAHFAAFSLRALGVRRMGSAAMDLAYVAAGRFEGYWELRLSPWDWAAGMLMVKEAGGKISRTDGGHDIFSEPPSLLATNGLVHEQMLDVLNSPNISQLEK